jgi:hypothetical protein
MEPAINMFQGFQRGLSECFSANGSQKTMRSTQVFRVGIPLVAIVLAEGMTKAAVVTYPAPVGEVLSSEYEVEAEGKKVDVYTARVLDPPFAGKAWDFGGPYAFANFDLEGKTIVKIAAKRSLQNTVVRPQFPDVHLKVEDDHTVSITFGSPHKISVEPDGKKGPLLLFANPMEKEAPKAGSPDVIYFGPGIHQAGRVKVGDKQTVYLAGGAVVKGAIVAQGSNIRILGRGILDGSDYEWRKGPANFTVYITGTNVEVSGITIRGSSRWTIVPRASRQVTVRNVKLCGARVQNDDGINPCNSQDVLITDCFIRSDDDCVAMKGLDLNVPNNNVENIVVENCTLWCDRARIFLLGHESRAAYMRNIKLRHLEIIHYTMTPFLLEPGEEMRLGDVRIEHVKLHGEGQSEIARLKPVVNQYMQNKVPGHVRGVHFKDVEVYGQPGAYLMQLEGADDRHQVQDVTFEDVKVLGQQLKADSANMQVGHHVEGVRFVQ